MKKLVLALGLSMTILLSAVFAQQPMRKAAPQQKQETALSVKRTSEKKSAQFGKKGKRINPNAQKNAGKKQVVIRPQACYKSAKNQDKATVKLVVYADWGDGTGYQILMDNTGTLTNDFFDGESVLDAAGYDAVVASIPANAKPELGTSSVMGDEENPGVDSTVVDPGTYDLFVVNPTAVGEEVQILVAAGGGGFFEALKLEAGMTYVFSVTLGGWGDDVTLIPQFDLEAKKVIFPIGECGASDAEVRFEILNNGVQDITGCKAYYSAEPLFYTIDDDETTYDTIWETITFPKPLKYGESYIHTFATKINFTKDTALAVYAGVAPLEDETMEEADEENNATQNVVARKSAKTAPYAFQLENIDVMFDADEWGLDDEDGVTLFNLTSLAKPAITRCITMQAGKAYRLAFDYMAGYDFWGMFAIPANFGILFGKSGTDIATWDTVYTEEDAYQTKFMPMCLAVEAEENAEYSFAFYEDTTGDGGGIYLRNLAIAEVLEKDAKVSGFSTNMAHRIPESQANGKFSGNVTVANWGKADIDKVTVKVALDETELFSQEVTLGKADSVKQVPFEITTSGLKAGDEPKLTASVVFEGDEDLDNNASNIEIEVSDAEMAHDYVTEEMIAEADYGLGASIPVSIAVPFHFNQKDTLTAVSIGWAEAYYGDMDFGVAIYNWNPATEKVGNLVYQNTYRRGADAGQREYDLPSILIEPGDYLISAVQLSGSGYDLMTDGLYLSGAMYVIDGEDAVKLTTYGTPAIRAIFGHNGKPMAKDAAIINITKPVKDLGVFTNEQPITVVVRNNGYEAVNAPITVKVNETALPTQNLQIPAYGEAEITFKGDLSAPDATFVLMASVSLEGDEDPSNDTYQRTVRSMPPVNPYVMNFEYCDDFAINGEFVPAWKSVDISGANAAFGIMDVVFPHAYKPVGFIAFPNGVVKAVEANNGDRCGVVFGANNIEGDEGTPMTSNAWLISPKLKLTAATAKMSFAVRSYTNEYGLEQYNVMVSTTDNNPESFVKIGETREAPAEWTNVNVDLAEYAGKDVYVAIQYVSYDVFFLMVDDIVVGNVANETNAASVRATVYPNPAREMVLFNANEAIQQVSILNVAGNTVYTSADHMNTTEFRYNVKGLKAGMYLARIKTAQGVAVLKFVVR